MYYFSFQYLNNLMFESLMYEELIESRGVTSNLEAGNGVLII